MLNAVLVSDILKNSNSVISVICLESKTRMKRKTWIKNVEMKKKNAVGSGGIVLQAPTLTDSRVAIDAKISAIGSTLKTI